MWKTTANDAEPEERGWHKSEVQHSQGLCIYYNRNTVEDFGSVAGKRSDRIICHVVAICASYCALGPSQRAHLLLMVRVVPASSATRSAAFVYILIFRMSAPTSSYRTLY